MMYDIIIIGSGPAGMTAGLYSARAGKKVLIFEDNVVGGQIVTSPLVENYPSISHISGEELGFNMYTQCEECGVSFEFTKVTKIIDGEYKTVIADEKEYKSKALIVATGAYPRKLGILKEDLLLGKGIGYCVLCDGENYKGKVVGIVGGGNTAITNAIYLSNICKKVYIFQDLSFLTAEQTILDKLSKLNNVEVVLNSKVVELIGDEFLNSIKTNNNQIFSLDGLFISIGQNPNNYLVKNLINLDNYGFCITDDNCETNLSGIYAIGDIRSKNIRQLTTAVSDGTIAAINACKNIE